MELATRFNTVAAQVSVWTSQNPIATRLILAAVPVVVAVVTALATQQPVYACPTQGGCIGGD